MGRYIKRLFAILLLLQVFSYTASASDSLLDEIISKKVLRFGTTGDYRPFSFFNKDTQKYEGIDIDLINNLADTLGVKVEIYKTSWPTLMDDYKKGKFDIAMSGISKTLERQKVVFFSVGYLDSGKTAVALCKQREKFKSLPSIDKIGTRIVVNPGGTNNKFVSENIKKAKIMIYNDNTKIFGQLLSGNADVMFTDVEEAQTQHVLNPKLCATMPVISSTKTQKAALLPRDVVWKEYVDAWLNQIKTNGKLKEIINKYLPSKQPN